MVGTKSYKEALKSTNPDDILAAMMAGYETPEVKGQGNGKGGEPRTGAPPPMTKDCPPTSEVTTPSSSTPTSFLSKQKEREKVWAADSFQTQLHQLGAGFLTPQAAGIAPNMTPGMMMSGLPHQSPASMMGMPQLVAQSVMQVMQNMMGTPVMGKQNLMSRTERNKEKQEEEEL